MCARVLWMFVIVKLACMILFPIIWVLLAMIPRLHSDVEQLFYALPATPQQRVFTNKIEFNNSGGHLQGVQPYFYKGQEYTYFSGSSSTYAYLAVADANEVKKLHKLMFKPFKHAGGFQISGNWLAVGIEDNDARTTSVVQIYNIADPLAELGAPVATIERAGERERATAGAVAIQELDETLWVLVGDWSNRHVDFYKADISATTKQLVFHKQGEVDMINCSKDGWKNDVARPYQNINLLKVSDHLYLVGLSRGEAGDVDIADVFAIDGLSGSKPVLTKILSREFKAVPETRFVWGAGVSMDEQKRLTLYSCAQNIRNNVVVSLYR